MQRVLIVAAHPDDDVLGCGASMARWVSEGAYIRVVTLAEGVTSREKQPESVAQRHSAGHRALHLLGVTDISYHGLPDQKLDTIPMLDLAKTVTSEVTEFRPTAVVTHSPSDLNLDHRVTAEATMVACRPQPKSPVRQVLHFEVPSSTGWRFGADRFTPNLWIDVQETAQRKLEALGCFGPEIREWPHARSLEAVQALLRWRGASVGVTAAEAFEVSLWIQDKNA